MAPYLLHVNLVFLLFLAAYGFALRRGAWLTGRRAWLLLSALCAWILPLAPLSGATPLLEVRLPEVVLRASESHVRTTSLGNVLWAVHLAGCLFFVLRLLVRIHRTWQQAGRGTMAGSFFGHIHVPALADRLDEQAVRLHEQTHARLWHSADVLLFELLAALFWWQPAWWWALREVRLVHEYQADREAAHGHPRYAALLTAQALGTAPSTLINGFSRSNLKPRILMLHRTTFPRAYRTRILLLIPTVTVALVATSWRAAIPAAVAVLPQDPVKQVEQMPTYPGGMDGLIAFMVNAIDYPASAVEAGVEGTVYTEFVVDVTGVVRDIRVKRGVHPDLDAEAVRVLGTMARWEPGRNGGQPVPVSMVLPVAFRLPKDR